MLDRDNFEAVKDNKIRNIRLVVTEARKKKENGILYRWYIPANKRVHFDGFKNGVITGLIENGYHVTDFLPEIYTPDQQRVTPGNEHLLVGLTGYFRVMYITWIPAEKERMEREEGYVFL